MALVLRGNGVVEGLTSLPNNVVTADNLAAGSVTLEKLSSTANSTLTDSTAFSVYRTANESLSAGNRIGWNAITNDTEGAFNTSTGRYTIPKTGYWFFHLIITSASAQGTPYFYLNIDGNRTRDLIEALSWSTNTERHASTLLYCNQGSLADIIVHGTSFTVQGGNENFNSSWQGFYLGA